MFAQEKQMNAEQKAHAFHGLAKSYLKSDEVFLALHAEIASEIASLDKILYNHYEDAYVMDLKKEISYAISDIDFDSNNVEAIILNVRETIVDHLNFEVREEWNTLLPDVSFFGDSILVEVEEKLRELSESRLENNSVDKFVEYKRSCQAENLEKANNCYDSQEYWNAIECCYNADLDGFEAWLVQRSLTLGDDSLVQCELLWALACATLEQMGSLPEEPVSALNLERSRLAWVAGPEEALSLSEVLYHPKYSKF
jgi:hypothetical protein